MTKGLMADVLAIQIDDIRAALNTEERGSDLVAVAKAAHEAELKWAKFVQMLDDDEFYGSDHIRDWVNKNR